MTIDCDSVEQFFAELQAALDKGLLVKKADEIFKLRFGFSDGNDTYLIKIDKLKDTKKLGIDPSIYLNLK